MNNSAEENCDSHSVRRAWETRSRLWGATLRSVLLKGAPEVLNEHLHRWQRDFVLRAARRVKCETSLRVLDVGCGYGRISEAILEHHPGATITGVDLAQPYVDLFQQRTGQRGIVGNVESLPEDLGSFDFIVCVTVLMYVGKSDIDPTLRKLLEGLAPGGIMAIIEPHRSGDGFQTLFGLLEILRRNASTGGINTGGHHFREPELRRAIDDGGGTILETSRLPATTLLFLPMFAMAKFLPRGLATAAFAPIRLVDQILTRFRLPTIHIGHTVARNRQSP